MLTLKLQRIGKKKQAHFRLVIQEKSKNPKSNVLEILGWYNPRSKAKEFKTERIQYWLGKGATATPTVHNLLVDAELIKESKVKNVKMSKKRTARLEADKKVQELKVKVPAEVKSKETEPAEAVQEEAKPAEPVKEDKIEEAPIEEVKDKETKTE